MDWPSDRVPPGGIFQTPKVKYNPETKKFLQDLMQESKLTMFQRNKQNYNLRSSEPSSPSSSSKFNEKGNKDIIIKNGYSRRRNYNSILESGAYNREAFVPKQRGVDREFAKKHLQDFMAFGKEVKKTEKPTKEPNEIPELNRFDQIKQEIQERVDWLAEMEQLGEGHKYRTLIEQQIAARVREMGRLKTTDNTSIHEIL